jgi:signal transduction histidine kinase
VDGVQRLLSFRSVAGYPLIVVAGFEETEFLAESVALRNRYFAAAAAATAMLLIEALLVTWQAHVQDRARETAEHANRMKSDFLATISHELRTPMNGVLGMLALLEGDDITPAHASRLQRHGDRQKIAALLDDILDFSKLGLAKCHRCRQLRSGDCQCRGRVAATGCRGEGPAPSPHRPSVPDAVVTD